MTYSNSLLARHRCSNPRLGRDQKWCPTRRSRHVPRQNPCRPGSRSEGCFWGDVHAGSEKANDSSRRRGTRGQEWLERCSQVASASKASFSHSVTIRYHSFLSLHRNDWSEQRDGQSPRPINSRDSIATSHCCVVLGTTIESSGDKHN